MFQVPQSTKVRGLLRCLDQGFFIPTFEEAGYDTVADLRSDGREEVAEFVKGMCMPGDNGSRFLDYCFGEHEGSNSDSSCSHERPPATQVGRVLDKEWLKIVEPLYSLHMGCENMGPLLYSVLRFVKPRVCLEVGAGYTTAFMLQALEDNAIEEKLWMEWKPLANAEETLKSWLVPDIATERVSPSLHCVDNLAHSATTAHRCLLVAERLGIDSRLHLHLDDGCAFINESIETVPTFDFIWLDGFLDFAQSTLDGPRRKILKGELLSDIIAEQETYGNGVDKLLDMVWPRIAPGGFLMLHSTLTNLAARQWLEGKDGRGPPSGAVISLLEPLKRFQNSCTLIQRRPAEWAGEPIYSSLP